MSTTRCNTLTKAAAYKFDALKPFSHPFLSIFQAYVDSTRVLPRSRKTDFLPKSDNWFDPAHKILSVIENRIFAPLENACT